MYLWFLLWKTASTSTANSACSSNCHYWWCERCHFSFLFKSPHLWCCGLRIISTEFCYLWKSHEVRADRVLGAMRPLLSLPAPMDVIPPPPSAGHGPNLWLVPNLWLGVFLCVLLSLLIAMLSRTQPYGTKQSVFSAWNFAPLFLHGWETWHSPEVKKWLVKIWKPFLPRPSPGSPQITPGRDFSPFEAGRYTSGDLFLKNFGTLLQVAAQTGHSATVVDMSEDILQKSLKRIEESVARVGKKQFPDNEAVSTWFSWQSSNELLWEIREIAEFWTARHDLFLLVVCFNRTERSS